jgi:cell division protein FtsW (lipid II flippase)
MSGPKPTPARAHHRRNTELMLVLMAGIITAAAYILAALGTNSQIPARIGVFMGLVLGLVGLAHLSLRAFAPGAEPTLLPITVFLHGLGYVMIARISERLAGLQTNWSVVAVAGFAVTLFLVQRPIDLARYKWTLLFAGTTLLVLPLVPGLGRSVGGARIWVQIGPLNFQPGEFAKLALAIFFAGYLAERRELIASGTWKIGPLRLPELRDIAPIAVAWVIAVMIMVGQQDLGSSLMFFTLFVVMMWVATERPLFLGLGATMFAIAAVAAWNMFGHVQTRVDIWLDPWSRPYSGGFQIIQALYGFADGGITGTGLGRGNPRKVPAAATDFIFAAVSEELGLLGGATVLIAYMLFIGAGLRIAIRTDNSFEKLLAVGLTTIIGFQAFLISAGVLKMLPLTGVTLPFMSYGGSSLVSSYILLALLLRVSHSGARRRGEEDDDLSPAERYHAWRLRRAEIREVSDTSELTS